MKFREDQKYYLGVQGAYLVDLEVNQDPRGLLYEMLHDSDMMASVTMKQIYIVSNPVRNTIRAFHRHEHLWDFFHIIRGSAIFCLVSDKSIDRIVLSERKPQLLVVPPHVYHGWMGLEDNTTLVSIGSEEYDKENPDEERVEWDSFDALFIEKYYTPPFVAERK